MRYSTEDFMKYAQQRIGDLHQYEYEETMQKVASLHDFAVKLVEQDQMEKQAFRTFARAFMPAITTVGRANRQVARQALERARAQGGTGLSRYRAAQNAYDKLKFRDKARAADYLTTSNTGNHIVDSRIARTTNKYLNSQGYGEKIKDVQQQFLNDVRGIRARARQTQVGTPEWNKLQQDLDALTARGQELSKTYGVKFNTGIAQKRLNDFSRGRTEQAIVGDRRALNEARTQRNYNQQEAANRQQWEQNEAARKSIAENQVLKYNENVDNMRRAIYEQQSKFNTLHSNGIDITRLRDPIYVQSLPQDKKYLVSDYVASMEKLHKDTAGKVKWQDFTIENRGDANLVDNLLKKNGLVPKQVGDFYTPGTYTPSPAPTAAGQPITRSTLANTAGAAEAGAAAGAAEAGAAQGWGQYALPAGIGFGAGVIPTMMSSSGNGSENQALQMQNAMLMQQLMQVRQNNDSFGNRLLNLFNSDTIFNR